MAKPSEGRKIGADAQCGACEGTGLYVGMAERDGTAVVCYRCHGTGQVLVEWIPFQGRQPVPRDVTRVHVARGYGLSSRHPKCQGGLPVAEWAPGAHVPADELLYCPYLYTHQEWCAHPVRDGVRGSAPLRAGDVISACRYWSTKAECWAQFRAADDTPTVTE